MNDWQQLEDEDNLEYHRAILEGYLVFLRTEPFEDSYTARKQQKKKHKDAGAWFIHILMPPDERQKHYLAGPGFGYGTDLQTAKTIALELVRRGRGLLMRDATREPRAPSQNQPSKDQPSKNHKKRKS
jgi:hypothetical protein